MRLPPGYERRFASEAMRRLPMTDWYVDRLFDFLPALGVTVIAAAVSRFVIDLNRPPDGKALYPGRYETGLVPLASFDGSPVFADPPDGDDIAAARRAVYDPYHAALGRLLDERRRGGRAVLFDLHSVTPFATRISGPLTHEIMLGDRDGTSCDAWLTDAADKAYADAGFSVVRNDPYKGGWITASNGARPDVDALQIEMSWAAYMDPEHPETAVGSGRFEAARKRLRSVFEALLPAVARRLPAG